MKLFAALLVMNLILWWLTPDTATAIVNSDRVVVGFAVWGLAHLEWLACQAVACLWREIDRLNAECRRFGA